MMEPLKNLFYPKNEQGERELSKPRAIGAAFIALGAVAATYIFITHRNAAIASKTIQAKVKSLQSLIPQDKKALLFDSKIKVSTFRFKKNGANIYVMNARKGERSAPSTAFVKSKGKSFYHDNRNMWNADHSAIVLCNYVEGPPAMTRLKLSKSDNFGGKKSSYEHVRFGDSMRIIKIEYKVIPFDASVKDAISDKTLGAIVWIT